MKLSQTMHIEPAWNIINWEDNQFIWHIPNCSAPTRLRDPYNRWEQGTATATTGLFELRGLCWTWHWRDPKDNWQLTQSTIHLWTAQRASARHKAGTYDNNSVNKETYWRVTQNTRLDEQKTKLAHAVKDTLQQVPEGTCCFCMGNNPTEVRDVTIDKTDQREVGTTSRWEGRPSPDQWALQLSIQSLQSNYQSSSPTQLPHTTRYITHNLQQPKYWGDAGKKGHQDTKSIQLISTPPP